MKYLNKSFSVGTENSAAYRDNYDRIFGKKAKPEKQPAFERCHECGSWEAQCSAPGPVPGCACARCLRAALDEAQALLQTATDNAFDSGAKAQGLEDSHRFAAMRKERDEARADLARVAANRGELVLVVARTVEERDALKAALREMVECGEGCPACGDGRQGGCGCRYERAREALGEVE